MAIIVRNQFNEPGIHFATPDDLTQQLGYMSHPKGKRIDPHIHNAVPRQIDCTFETLFIRKGRLRVDFYSPDQDYLYSKELYSGEAIMLLYGGHGFEVLDDVEMIEVKQGPYAGDMDKTRFPFSATTEINIRT